MGLLSGTQSGDAQRAGLRREQEAWARLLGPGEQVSSVHRLGRSTFVFTNRRLVVVDEALSGRQVEYQSLPYRSISSFSVDSSGHFDAEADLRIWVVGRTAPIERSFGAGADVYAVQALLASYVATGHATQA